MIRSIDHRVKFIKIIDEKFSKEIFFDSETIASYGEFILNSIYYCYKFTRECPMVNILSFIKNNNPSYLSNNLIRETKFYKKHLCFFNKNFPKKNIIAFSETTNWINIQSSTSYPSIFIY